MDSRKLLTRNSYATPKTTTDSKVKVSQSKADILNLISSDSTALARIGWTFIGLWSAQLELVLGASYVWYLLGKLWKWSSC